MFIPSLARHAACVALAITGAAATAAEIRTTVWSGVNVTTGDGSATSNSASILLNDLSVTGYVAKFNDSSFTVVGAQIFANVLLSSTASINNTGLLASNSTPSFPIGVLIDGEQTLDAHSATLSIAEPADVFRDPVPDDQNVETCSSAGQFLYGYGECVTGSDSAFVRYTFAPNELAALLGYGTVAVTGLGDLAFTFLNDPLVFGKVDYAMDFLTVRVHYSTYCTASPDTYDACEPYQDEGDGDGNAVPTPGTLALLALGLAGLAVRRHRRA